MSNEALETIKQYFSMPENTMHFFGNQSTAQKVVNFMSHGKILAGDVPDMAILFNGSCLAIEHFEFDNYKNSKNGSQSRIEQARIERKLDKVSATEHGILLHDEIKGATSYQQYISNVSTAFINHYKRIDTYKNNLIESGVITPSTSFEMAFLIDDTSPLGMIAYDDAGTKPVVLAQSREFLMMMRRNPNVDFVIACSSVGSNNYIWLISQESLDEYDKNIIDYANMDLVDTIPKVMGYEIVINKNDFSK